MPVTGVSSVNWMMLGIQLGVIALVLALLMREIGAILIFTVVGVIIHVIVDIVMPMVRGRVDRVRFQRLRAAIHPDRLSAVSGRPGDRILHRHPGAGSDQGPDLPRRLIATFTM